MDDLLERLEASNRIYRTGYVHGFNAGKLTGHSHGLTAALEEIVAKYDQLDHVAFYDYMQEAKRLLELQEGDE